MPGLGRSPGEGTSCPLQYSGLENSMDCIIHGVAKTRTQLSDFDLTSLHFMKVSLVMKVSLLPSSLSFFSFSSPQNKCIKTLEKKALQVDFLEGPEPGPPLGLWHLISAEVKV